MFVFFAVVLALVFVACLLAIAGAVYVGVKKANAKTPEERRNVQQIENGARAGCGLAAIGVLIVTVIVLFCSAILFMIIMHKLI